jgi:hypothetical protein
MMSNPIAEWLFLLAFCLPPAAVVAGAALLILPDRSARIAATRPHGAPVLQ